MTTTPPIGPHRETIRRLVVQYHEHSSDLLYALGRWLWDGARGATEEGGDPNFIVSVIKECGEELRVLRMVLDALPPGSDFQQATGELLDPAENPRLYHAQAAEMTREVLRGVMRAVDEELIEFIRTR